MHKIAEITYAAAADRLGVKHSTINQAVSRGVLTALPRQSRKPGRLALDQVELFVGKQLSLAELSTEDAIIWHDIDRAIAAIGKRIVTQLDMNERAIAVMADIINRVTDLAIDAILELRETAASDLMPDTLVKIMLQSKSFNQVALLLGIDMSTIPDDTMLAIESLMFNAITRAAMRLAAIQLETVPKVDIADTVAC